MSNVEIAALFEELADLMELAGENYFKIRAYRNAAGTIRGLAEQLTVMPPSSIAALPGIGKAISEKIGAAVKTGTFPTLEKWRLSGLAALRPLAGLEGMGIPKLRGLIKDLNIGGLDDLKKTMDDGDFSGYKKIDANLKQVVKDYILVNHG